MGRREIKKSQANYLEAILVIIRQHGACRMTDIAEYTGYSKASVSNALKKLEEDGYVIRDDWRILLTEKGSEIALNIHERHIFFMEWFSKIGISPETAAEDASLIERVLSDESFERIRSYLSQVETDSVC